MRHGVFLRIGARATQEEEELKSQTYGQVTSFQLLVFSEEKKKISVRRGVRRGAEVVEKRGGTTFVPHLRCSGSCLR